MKENVYLNFKHKKASSPSDFVLSNAKFLTLSVLFRGSVTAECTYSTIGTLYQCA